MLSLSLLALCSPFPLPQIEFPVGGWSKPVWESEPILDTSGAPPLDFTGDGYPDTVLVGGSVSYVIRVLDGTSGEIWFQWPPQNGLHLSASTAFGDVDGDGIQDILIGDLYFSGNLVLEGRILAFQGGSGHLLWETWGAKENRFLGSRLIAQDLDGNGKAEIIHHYANELGVFQGTTGAMQWKRDAGKLREHGGRLKFLDLDGDQNMEILWQGQETYQGPITLCLLDGINGQTIWTHDSFFLDFSNPLVQFDANSDGVLDLLLVSEVDHGQLRAIDGKSGQRLWTRHGNWQTQGLGSKVIPADFDGDGRVEFLCRSKESYPDGRNGLIEVLDEASGMTLWSASGGSKDYLAASVIALDVDLDGVQDLVAASRVQIQAYRGSTGDLLWTYLPADSEESPKLHRASDLDGDGIQELVFSDSNYSTTVDSAGVIGVLEGVSGALRWRREGEYHLDRLGGILGFRDLDLDGNQDLIALTSGTSAGQRLIRLNSIDGSSFWETDAGRIDLGRSILWGDYDTVPGPDILLRNQYGDMFAIGGSQGDFLWHNNSNSSYFWDQFFFPMPDLDGDGVNEFTMLHEPGFGFDDSIRLYSGATGGYLTGIQSPTAEISSSAGGTVEITVHFPSATGHQPYRLLLSASGPGPTTLFGLKVPLTSDSWLNDSWTGIYPGNFFTAQEGRLSSSGYSLITVHANPGGIPSSMIGTSLFMAVVAGPVVGGWNFSSGVKSILIAP